MSHQDHDLAYRSAMSAALGELGSINEEIISVSKRMHQLDSALEALKPFLRSRQETATEDNRPTSESISVVAEPVHADQLIPHGNAIPEVMPQKIIESSDPIQRRINSVLGLAVA